MKKIVNRLLACLIMLSCVMMSASAAGGTVEPYASYITKRVTIDVPVRIPSVTISSPNNAFVETFETFDTICEIKVDAVVNENTGVISSVSPISYGVKAGYSSPWMSTNMQIQNLMPTNFKTGGIKISKDKYGIEADLTITASVRYRIMFTGNVPAYEEIKKIENLKGTGYAEAA